MASSLISILIDKYGCLLSLISFIVTSLTLTKSKKLPSLFIDIVLSKPNCVEFIGHQDGVNFPCLPPKSPGDLYVATSILLKWKVISLGQTSLKYGASLQISSEQLNSSMSFSLSSWILYSI